jgi:multiple sugar transport system ATP-binding protein
MARVELKDVSKVFDRNVVAVDRATFGVEDGEFAVILGPSGCGKTTLLRLVAGLVEATSGDIYIGDRRVNDVQPKDRDIAMVFQNYALYPHMTVSDNMAFGLKMRREKKDVIRKRVDDAAEILGIQTLLGRKPRELSGGQRQRVALGRAIVRQPQVFLYDEPLSNLDAKLRVKMRAELEKLHKRIGVTSVYVTHDQVEAMTLGQKIILLRDGVIQQISDSFTLYHRPRNLFVGGFIGSPPMNLFEGRLEGRDGGLVFRHPDFQIGIPSDKAGKIGALERAESWVLGIRPEDVYGPRGSREGKPEGKLRARVDLVEALGNEALVHLKTETSLFVSRVPPFEPPEEGDTVDVLMDLSMCHLFDRETEENRTL